jgi:hypothetical protein
MGQTTELREEVKRVFVALLLSRGFVRDGKDSRLFWTFRRAEAGANRVISVQWEKYDRPRFVVNFSANADTATLLGHGRLQPRPGALTWSWFRQDKPLLTRLFSTAKTYPAAEVVAEVVRLFPQIEEYWLSGTVGPQLRIHAA